MNEVEAIHVKSMAAKISGYAGQMVRTMNAIQETNAELLRTDIVDPLFTELELYWTAIQQVITDMRPRMLELSSPKEGEIPGIRGRILEIAPLTEGDLLL